MNRPVAKFQVGQIAVLKHSKKVLPFVIIEAIWESGGWFYKWNRRNAAAESMIRELTPQEVGTSKCENCDDLKHLFEMQNVRMDKATGKNDTLPDLATLLEWLLACKGLKLASDSAAEITRLYYEMFPDDSGAASPAEGPTPPLEQIFAGRFDENWTQEHETELLQKMIARRGSLPSEETRATEKK